MGLALAVRVSAGVAQGKCLSAAFVARNKYAVLEGSTGGSKVLRVLAVPGFAGVAVGAAAHVPPLEKGRTEALPSHVTKIFAAGSNKLLLASEDSVRAASSKQQAAGSRQAVAAGPFAPRSFSGDTRRGLVWQVFLFDIPTRRLSSGQRVCVGGTPRAAVWSPDFQTVAILGKHSLMLLQHVAASREEAVAAAGDAKTEFRVLAAVHENIRVKGGAWDALRGKKLGSRQSRTFAQFTLSLRRQEGRAGAAASTCISVSGVGLLPAGAFVYATLSHVKFVLPSGDKGIICSLVEPIYILS